MRLVTAGMATQLAGCGWLSGLANEAVTSVAMGPQGLVTVQSSGDACVLRLFDADGDERWRHRSACDGQVFQIDDVVVFGGQWATQALDVETGALRWTRAWDEDPALFRTRSGALLVHSDREQMLYGLRPSDGETVWSAPGRRETIQVGTSTVVVDQRWHHATTGEGIRPSGAPTEATFELHQGVVRGADPRDSGWFGQWTCDHTGTCRPIAGAMEVISARTTYAGKEWFVQETPSRVFVFDDTQVWRMSRTRRMSFRSASHVGRAEDRYRWMAGRIVDLEQLRWREGGLGERARRSVIQDDVVVFVDDGADAAAVFDPHSGELFVMTGIPRAGAVAVHDRRVAAPVAAGVWLFDLDQREWSPVGAPGMEPTVAMPPETAWTHLEPHVLAAE